LTAEGHTDELFSKPPAHRMDGRQTFTGLSTSRDTGAGRLVAAGGPVMSSTCPAELVHTGSVRIRCPALVGRDRELGVLSGLVAAAREGSGAGVFVSGEAGIGKSCLMRAAVRTAREEGVLSLVGRAVPASSPAPFRPLTEALLSTLRHAGVPESQELRPFRPALARLIPQWHERGAVEVETSAVVLGEGVIRLLRLLGPAGSLLVLEDLHWADPETLAVVEYICDNVEGEQLSLLVSARPDGPAPVGVLAAALSARGAATLLPLVRLDEDAVAEMVAACPLPAGLAGRAMEVVGAAEGVPLLVEELLAMAVDPAAPARVPATVAETVRLRMSHLDAAARRVLAGAALLGRRFDWTVLAAATGLNDEQVLGALRQAVDVQLVDADDAEFRFRHALTRDGVLASLLAPEVAALAAQTRRALEVAQPGLPGAACVLAAELAGAAGDAQDAAVLLVRAGRRALRQAALVTAERLLRRAGELAVSDGVRRDAGDALVEVLATAGRVEDAVAVAAQMSALSGAAEVDDIGRVRVRLRLARAAVAADRWDTATAQLDEARPVVAGQPGLAAEFAALSAQVAIGRADLDGAARLARDAVSLAERAGQPEVQCEGWEIIGRTQRPSSLAAARESFDLARAIAEQHGLVVWQLRALHELGTIDLLDSGNIDRLLEARRGAEQAGALTMTAVLDVQLAAGHIMRGEPAQAVAAGMGAAEAGRRLRAEGVRRMGLCFVAIAHGVLLDRDRMDVAAQEAVAAAGGELDIAAAVWGDARGIFALLNEDRRGARRALECAASRAWSWCSAVVCAARTVTAGHRSCSPATRSPTSGTSSRETCSATTRWTPGPTPPPRRSRPPPTALTEPLHLSSGPEPAAEYLTQVFADLLIHTWDLARAGGADDTLDPDLIAPCASWFAGVADLCRQTGVVGARPVVPATADPQTRLLAEFGRAPC
jgi:hypothetical protein